MKQQLKLTLFVATVIFYGVMAQPQTAHAKAGATDPIPGTSKGGTSTGGGGKSITPTPPPALSSGTVTFTAAGPVNGVTPVCTGDYRIQAYYPTLLDMTLNVSVSSLNVPDGTVLYVNAVGTAGTFYPYSSNAIIIVGGAGICAEKIFVGLGVGLAGVVITDDTGTPIFAGN